MDRCRQGGAGPPGASWRPLLPIGPQPALSLGGQGRKAERAPTAARPWVPSDWMCALSDRAAARLVLAGPPLPAAAEAAAVLTRIHQPEEGIMS